MCRREILIGTDVHQASSKFEISLPAFRNLAIVKCSENSSSELTKPKPICYFFYSVAADATSCIYTWVWCLQACLFKLDAFFAPPAINLFPAFLYHRQPLHPLRPPRPVSLPSARSICSLASENWPRSSSIITQLATARSPSKADRKWQARRQRIQTQPSRGKVIRDWANQKWRERWERYLIVGETTASGVTRLPSFSRKRYQRTNESSSEISYHTPMFAQSGKLFDDPGPCREGEVCISIIHLLYHGLYAILCSKSMRNLMPNLGIQRK